MTYIFASHIRIWTPLLKKVALQVGYGIGMNRNDRVTIRLSGIWLVAYIFTAAAHADVNWDGEGSQGNFSWSENWYGNTVPSLPGNFSAGNLVFNYRNNTSQLNQFYDWGGWASINDIIWETTWTAPTTFNGNGNGLNFNQRLENRSSQTVTIGSMNLSGGKNGATQIELNPANGDLTLNGNIYNDNNLGYKVYGANNRMLTVNTALTGNSSVALDIEQYSKVKFTAAQTMGSAAAYNVKQGELWLDTGGSLASGSTVNLGQADANVAKFYLAPSAGGMTHAGNITVANSGGTKVLGSLAASGTNTFSGNITLNGTALLENVSSTGTLAFSGSFSGASGINVGVTNATGRVLLSGSNSYTGTTLVQQGGTLVVNHLNALGATNGGTTVQSGATLEYLNSTRAAAGEVVTIQGTGTSNQGAVFINQTSGMTYFDSKLVLASDARISSAGGNTYLSTVDTAGSLLNIHLASTNGLGGFTLTGSSKITGSGSVSLTRNSSAGSTVDFGNAVNDYTGGTTVGAGIQLSGSGTSLVGNITNNGMVQLSSGTNAFTGSISGTGSVSKSGATLLEMATSNSYTGSTTISGGTLVVSHNQSLGAITGTTTVSSLATLGFSNNISTAEKITLAGNGSSNSGALRNMAGTNTLSGQLTLLTNVLVKSDTGLLTLAGAIVGSTTNAKTLTMDGAGNFNLNGSIDASVKSLVKNGSGTTTINGTAAATTVTVNDGTLNTGSADRLADNAGLAVTAGTLGVGGSDTVGSVAISSSGTVNVTSGATLTATADSTISGTAKATGGTVAISNGAKLTLANSAATTTSDISVEATSSLVGTGGTTGKISGSGLLGPGNSPGILTASQVDVSSGLDFAFEFTGTGAPVYSSTTASRNDLLHLTSGSSPFVGSFSSANSISFFFNDASLNANLLTFTPSSYLGGFFVDSLNFDIASLLSAATKSYYIVDANGSFSYNGVNYSLLTAAVTDQVVFTNANQTSSAFDTGTTSGTVLSVTMVPEPSSASLMVFGSAALLALRRRKAA